MTPADKVRELRCRRTLARRGYRLERVRRRDKRALDYGHYRLVTANGYISAEHLTLDKVEELVAAGRRFSPRGRRS